MSTTTIRVASATRDRINDLARRREIPAGELVDELVREADDRALLAAAAHGWDRLGNDSAALASYRADASDLAAFEAPMPDY